MQFGSELFNFLIISTLVTFIYFKSHNKKNTSNSICVYDCFVANLRLQIYVDFKMIFYIIFRCCLILMKKLEKPTFRLYD